MVIAAIAIAWLVSIYVMRRCLISVEKDSNLKQVTKKKIDKTLKINDQILKPDDVLLKPAEKLKPDWISLHPTVPLIDFGLTNFEMLEGFLKEHGKELKSLNLLNLDINNELDDDQFQQLIQYCPKSYSVIHLIK